jgi:hypothetical protein
MKNLTLGLSALLALSVATPVRAQYGSMGVFTWNWSYPASDTKEYLENDSWVGLMLEGRRYMSPTLSASLGVGFNEFYENTNRLIEIDNLAISGNQYRNVLLVPMLVGLQYNFARDGETRPYVGLGAGAYYSDQLMDIGIYTFEADVWHFGVAPQVGVLIPSSNRDTKFVLDVRYHLPIAAGGYIGDESLSMAYWTVGAGLSWSSGY